MNTPGFVKFRNGPLRVWISRKWHSPHLLEKLSVPWMDVVKTHPAGLIKRTESSVVLRMDFPETNLIYKVVIPRGTRERLKSLYLPPLGERIRRGNLELARHEFLTAPLVAYGYRRRRGLVAYHLVVTRELRGSLPLSAYSRRLFLPGQSNERLRSKNRFLTQLGREIRRMHDAGIFHSDLRADNVLVEDHSPGLKFYFIDHDKPAERWKSRGKGDRLRIQNLVQLNKALFPEITLADRMRFFKGYLEKGPGKPSRGALSEAEKDLARKVILLTHRWRKKKVAPSGARMATE